MITLTEQECDKIALWLKQEIEGDKVLLEQMKKIQVSEMMIKQRTIEIAAKSIVMKIRNSNNWIKNI